MLTSQELHQIPHRPSRQPGRAIRLGHKARGAEERDREGVVGRLVPIGRRRTSCAVMDRMRACIFIPLRICLYPQYLELDAKRNRPVFI